jgi:hypothetical protein
MKVKISDVNTPESCDIHSLKYNQAYQYTSGGKIYTIISLSHPNKLGFPDILRMWEKGFEFIRLDRAAEITQKDWANLEFTEYKGTITLDYTG